VERHGADLEGKADHDQGQGNDHRRLVETAGGHQAAQLVEVRLASQPIDQRQAVERHRRSERAEEEVLEARLGAGVIVAQVAGQHVQCDRKRLQRQEDHDQVGSGAGQAGPDDRGDQDGVEIAARAQPGNAHCDQRADAARQQDHHPENLGHVIVAHHPAEHKLVAQFPALRRDTHQEDNCGDPQQAEAGHVANVLALRPPPEQVEGQHKHGQHHHQDFG